MSLEESVALDISEAQSRIDDIGSALTSAAQSFATALDEATQVLSSIRIEQVDASAVTASIDEAVAASDTSPTVTADASGVTTSIDDAVAAVGTPDVPVTADTSEVASSIDSAVANASPPPLEVPVDAGEITSSIDSALASVDTSGLQSELGDVSTAATGAGNAAKEAGLGIGSIAPAAALATGEVGSLQEIIGQVTPAMAGAAVATAGVVSAGKDLFEAALQQDTALSRLRQTYGDLAASIEHVNFGGINEDLSTLAVRTGANVDGLRNFAASFGQLGKSAGDTLPHVADVSQQIELLAVRASVLNPNLGTADEIVQRLSTSLARGGRFLSAYGISLSTAQINAEALRETGKQTASELSIYDKIVAGATLSTQQLGGALGTDINEGAQKAQVQLRSLKAAFEETLKAAGAPLIQPTIDAFKALEPVLAALASVLGASLGGALHVVVPLLELLATILQPIADLVARIPAPVFTAVAAFEALQLVLNAAPVTNFVGSLLGLDAALTGVTAEAGVAAVAVETSGGVFASVGSGVSGLVGGLSALSLGYVGVAGFAVLALRQIENEAAAQRTAQDQLKGYTEALADNSKSVAENIEAFKGTGNITKDFGGDLVVLGGTTRELSAALAQGQGATDKYIASLTAGRPATEAQTQAQLDLSVGTRRLIGDLDTAAHSTLTSAVAHDQLSRSVEVTAIKQNTAKNGTVDWIAVLNQLRPQLQQAGVDAGQLGTGADTVSRAQQELTANLQAASAVALDHEVAIGRLTDTQRNELLAVHTSSDGTRDYAAALKEVDPSLASQAELQGRVNDGLADTRTAFEVAKDAADAYKTAVDQALGVLTSADEANIKLHDSLDKVNKALQDAKGSIDLNTEAGRNARKEVDGLANDTTSYIETLIREGASQQTVTAARDEGIKRLQTLEATYPQLKPLIDPYIATILAIPPDKGTNVHADGTGVATANVQDVQAAVDALHDRGIEVDANTLPAQIALDNLIAKFGQLEAAEIAAVQALNGTGIPLGPLTAGGGPRMGGGPVWPGVWTVGEGGPETLVLEPGGTGFVFPNSTTQTVNETSHRVVNITINQVAQNEEATAFAIAARLGVEAER